MSHWKATHSSNKIGEAVKTATNKVDFIPEVSTDEAAKILGVSKNTVIRLKKDGLLEYRNAAPLQSSRPVYRFTLASVKKIRHGYTKDEPQETIKKLEQRRSIRTKKKSNHIQIDDD